MPIATRQTCRLGLLTLIATLAAPAFAHFARTWEPVPLDRLFRNVGDYVQQHPKEARGYYTLGRLHSLAFVKRDTEAEVILKEWRTGKALTLPEFPPYESVAMKREVAGRVEAEALRHLAESVRNYLRATELAPQEALYWMGLGWMLEQGMPHAAEAQAPFLNGEKKAPAEAWRRSALRAYRQAYSLSVQQDLKRPDLFGYADGAISQEAGEGIVRLLAGRAASPAEARQLTEVRRSLATLKRKPMVVTPILFPLDRPRPLETLLARGRRVSFDMAGIGRREGWPWVREDTAILVWDPRKKGRITSGTQLFGSFTWSMFWKDGYEPLAALDDNHDGWLTGPELEGLALWQDRDGNGVSDPGEVLPLAAHGIVRVATSASGSNGGVPFNPCGVQRKDGQFLPTYDWMPASRRLPRTLSEPARAISGFVGGR